MMPSAPPARATAPARSEGREGRDSDSAAPFATALDGAMADGSSASRIPSRSASGDAGRDHGRDAANHPGRHLSRGREDSPPPADPRTPGAPRRHEAAAPADPTSDKPDPSSPTDVPPPAGVPAGLWALLLAAAAAAPPVATSPSPGTGTSTTAASLVPGPTVAPVGTATPDLAATLLAAPTTAVPAVPTDGPVAPNAPVGPPPTVPDLLPPAPATATPAPVPSAPAAQPVLPAGPPAGGPADPAAAFATLAATAGATITAVTTTAPPPAPVLARTTTAAGPTVDVPDSGVPAAVPLDGAIGGPAPVPVTGGQPSGSGNPGRDGGASDSSRDGVPDLAGLPPASSTTPIATAPVTEAAPAAAPAPAPPVSGQLAQHLAVLRGVDDGEHSMTLVLTPERLGPVEIQVTVSKGSLDLSLRGAHEQGRAALMEALPDLRRDLESAGLTCSRLEVDRTTGGAFTTASTSSSSAGSAGLGQSASQMSQQQTPGQRGGQHDWSDGRFRSGLRTADSGDNHSVPSSTRSTSPGVDVRV
jgi:flagellar hook-length control protein FliK